MAKLTLTIELDYDAETMHGDDAESKAWFFSEILHDEIGELLLHSNNIGDTLGVVRVISVAAPSNAELCGGTSATNAVLNGKT